ncbi:BgTH12-05563 [Blumeria graminis f. sp. triticale]|uniref:Bgt-50 n=3 Tax=Blumeria graminis TaxID=34373 RepID=A0A381L3G9_BLUGR|nr:hypothetical protein BGT96224_50 [Blumeria graminis f. sp. tritici 96224]CAD6503818.1 BgTH12-05563 [Blumeria graminis f. sp. triticale]VDB90456.1 Bgt-50 [Blumeria graminis f. sp. tritici]
MYWPAGAPRIYAACRNKATKDYDTETEDYNPLYVATQNGCNLCIDTERRASEVGGGEDQKYELGSDLIQPTTPKTPNIQPVEQDCQNQDISLGDNEDASHINAESKPLLSLKISRNGYFFAVITSVSLTVWQTKPTAILAVVVRSKKSLHTYGPNVSLLMRPDAAIFVVHTTSGYLITYTLATNPDGRVYNPFFIGSNSSQVRRPSDYSGSRNQREDRLLRGPGEGSGLREVSIRFRMAIQVDAGIEKALALDDELVVATHEPAAIQCIRWIPDDAGRQTSTQLFSKMEWLSKKISIIDMVHDRPMNLSAWITSDGKAYAVQRLKNLNGSENIIEMFKGNCFHIPTTPRNYGKKVAINARFSLIAVGCFDSTIRVYTARDYDGNIPPSHIHRTTVSENESGKLNCLAYSPDGYCLFAGYQHGWAMWSVFGKPGATSFGIDSTLSQIQGETWLEGVKEAVWLGGGLEILIIGIEDNRIWMLEMARSAITGCFGPANTFRTLLQTNSTIALFRGYDLSDLSTISTDPSLWHVAQIPSSYLHDQWPMRCSVISPDGRYIAVAGRRGLAHYSVFSGKWKTFVDEDVENEFQVRGGMCWYQNILVAAIEYGNIYQLRLFSREADLNNISMLQNENLAAPAVIIAPSGEDSLLVYTSDNLLYHFIFVHNLGHLKIKLVGQIALHGIIRAPARVRGLSWVLPNNDRFEDDRSLEIAFATVLFLVDGKLVILQPSLNEEQILKYDMRIIAQNVEFYILMRDLSTQNFKSHQNLEALSRKVDSSQATYDMINSLHDSLWIFEGVEMKGWIDVQEILQSNSFLSGRDLPPTVSIPVDFYPLSILINKGIVLGLEPDLIQRRDVNFAFLKFTIRTHLLIPLVLQFHLSRYDYNAALDTARKYQSLDYFAHALEILLHNVLDLEVDTKPSSEEALLPRVISFLMHFHQYLDIVVQCTRKTEVRSWHTLFAYLPPAQELFEESLRRGLLKTAGGYLIILQTFQEISSSSEQLARLFAKAKEAEDWSLCKELARFLMAIDQSGTALEKAMRNFNLNDPLEGQTSDAIL